MKFSPIAYPECGEQARGTSETIPGVAEFTEPDEHGNVDYTGETVCFWDGQMTDRWIENDELVALTCRNGHEWGAARGAEQ